MRVTVRGASALLNTTEKQISDWIESGDLPAYKINDQYRINRSELLEWATTRNLAVVPELFHEKVDEDRVPSVSSCIARGKVFRGVDGDTREQVLQRIVQFLPLGDDIEREMLLDLLLARESLGTTTIGDGIAIPHVRNPIVLTTDEPMISLCYLDRPVDFGAIDGNPVHALFVLICPTIRIHLEMLAKLAFLLRKPEFRELVRRRSSEDEILRVARQIEESG
jgi:PTS system nitrogen regulatory IIA component